MLEKHKEALGDARNAIRIDPTFVKVCPLLIIFDDPYIIIIR